MTDTKLPIQGKGTLSITQVLLTQHPWCQPLPKRIKFLKNEDLLTLGWGRRGVEVGGGRVTRVLVAESKRASKRVQGWRVKM